jgi:hypothetical protein
MKVEITTPVLISGSLIVLLCSFAHAQWNVVSGAPPLSSIVREMEKAQSEHRPRTPYQVIREYRLSGTKTSSANANVVAQVDFRLPAGKDYSIQKWSGSSRGKQIVERVLDHETGATGPDPAQSALSIDNYDFALVGETVLAGRPSYLLKLKPRRREKDLIAGTAWVDKDSFRILQVEGEVAKAPSWWLKSVRIRMSFGDFAGTWLQTSMEAVADVRLFGSHTLISRILDYRGTDISASTILVPKSR